MAPWNCRKLEKWLGGVPLFILMGKKSEKLPKENIHVRLKNILVTFLPLPTMFTDPELAGLGLNQSEAKEQGIAYRLAKIPMDAILRIRTLSEPRGFMKALVDTKSDRILGFTAFGTGAGETMSDACNWR